MCVDLLDTASRRDSGSMRSPLRTASHWRRTGRMVDPTHAGTVSVADVRSRRSGGTDVDRSVEDDVFDDVSRSVVDLTQLELGADVDSTLHMLVSWLYIVRSHTKKIIKCVFSWEPFS